MSTPLKHNKSQVSFNLNNPSQSLLVKGVGSPTHQQISQVFNYIPQNVSNGKLPKKTEGFDKTALSSTFSDKITKIKNKPKTNVIEDQYVNGLQDEIKYLEMELKLLQEK